jgi:hypothetical protein
MTNYCHEQCNELYLATDDLTDDANDRRRVLLQQMHTFGDEVVGATIWDRFPHYMVLAVEFSS